MDITPPSDNSIPQDIVDDAGTFMGSMMPSQGSGPVMGDVDDMSQLEGAVSSALTGSGDPQMSPPPFDQVNPPQMSRMSQSMAPMAPPMEPIMPPPTMMPAALPSEPMDNSSQQNMQTMRIPDEPIQPPMVAAPAQSAPLQVEEPDYGDMQPQPQDEHPQHELPTSDIQMPENTYAPIPSSGRDDSEVVDADLAEVRKQALHALAPIANKLDLPPDERFKTMMQLIQATDSTELTKPAFEAAESIEDEAQRAQALLDVVNEIDYLEQAKKQKAA